MCASEISNLPDNALDIWRHCFTEMFNNAVDHSSGTRIAVRLKRTAVNAEIAIIDNGVGIFKKIQRAMKFSDERHSALELAKGKFTTDPVRHTGEGIFFTSKDARRLRHFLGRRVLHLSVAVENPEGDSCLDEIEKHIREVPQGGF